MADKLANEKYEQFHHDRMSFESQKAEDIDEAIKRLKDKTHIALK